MKNRPEIKFNKESCLTSCLKKGDRMLFDGPVEILIDELTVSGSLDYQVKLVISMPKSTNTIKLGPSYRGTDESKTKLN
jgi:hypothetical protein